MRSIDDGYSYDYYTFTRDVLDYYERKSEYEEEEREREYWERKCELDGGNVEQTFSCGEF